MTAALAASIVSAAACNGVLGNEQGYLLSGQDGGEATDASVHGEDGGGVVTVDGQTTPDGAGEDGAAGDATVDGTSPTPEASTADVEDASGPTDAAEAGAADAGDSSTAASDAGDAGDGGDAGDASCSTDLQTDPLDCGSCGHSCLGGQCVGGMCQPVTIAQGQGQLAQIATDGVYVFWTGLDLGAGGGTQVRRAPVSAIATSASDVTWTAIVGAGGTFDIRDVAVSGSNPDGGFSQPLFWTENGALGTSDENGGGSTLFTLADGGPVAAFDTDDLVTNGSRVFFSTAVGSGSVPMSVLYDGGDLATYDAGSDAGFVNTLAANGSTFFYAMGAPGLVWAAPAGGGAASLAYSSGSFNDTYIAIDGTNLYAMLSQEGVIVSCPIGGCVPPTVATTVVSGLPSPTALASDGSTLYWFEPQQDAGTLAQLMRCAPAHCTPQVIASGIDVPTDIVTDAVSIYWASQGSGWVVRLAK